MGGYCTNDYVHSPLTAGKLKSNDYLECEHGCTRFELDIKHIFRIILEIPTVN